MKYKHQDQGGFAVVGIIIAVLAVLVVAGVAVFFVRNNATQSTSENESTTASSSSPDFAPKSTDGASYVATLHGTAGDSTIEATIDYNGRGDSHYVGTVNGQPTEMYKIGSGYIVCSGAQCISAPTTSQPAGSGQAQYSAEDVATWKSAATYKGKQDCPAGSCSAWQIAKDGYTGTILVAQDGRVSRTVWTNDRGTFTIDLDYKEVTIARPDNVMSVPGR